MNSIFLDLDCSYGSILIEHIVTVIISFVVDKINTCDKVLSIQKIKTDIAIRTHLNIVFFTLSFPIIKSVILKVVLFLN